MTAIRNHLTESASVTRRSETWPVYNVGAQCAVTAVTIVALIVAIVLIVVL